MSPDPWKTVEEVVNTVYKRTIEKIGERKNDYSNIFFSALIGRASIHSRIERSLVTLLGEYAPLFFKPFFANTRSLPPPFDFEGEINGFTYQVKVVSGDKAFNSAVRDRVARASFKYYKPIILTIQGEFFEPQLVGRAIWYSAPHSWWMIGGEGSYKRFINIVYNNALKYRDIVWSLIKL